MIALGDPRIAIEASVTWGKESYDSDQTDHVKCPSENYVVDHHSKSDPNHPGPRKLMLFLVRKKQSKWASNPLNWLLLFIADGKISIFDMNAIPENFLPSCALKSAIRGHAWG